ncbi:membrane-bound lytic murein transglycosylase B [Bisgaardia hudsonensis]|uniref:Membrane-bound lytic murein transglycosylase B n=1 Tax=Bisgaardia hudsonensis TaxID=109472 RepID=A0A4R2N116_9PAST|nr:lytic murein transglycosylase [Bisgaardia hudsonensis]QLB13174.1 lytic transglycosylase [Bisgaardia hudsonensis]TCP13252.1 membrane-bound lytic murein transglycosylase B [Bisgaardia hudsonensis]
MLKLKLSLFIASFILGACSSNSYSIKPIDNDTTYNKPRTLLNFDDYVVFLKQKAVAQGVSAKLLNSQNNINYIQKAVDLDRKQAGRSIKSTATKPIANPHGVSRYLKRVLTDNKVNVAERRYWERLPELTKASERFGVQKEYLMALWGMESSFGYYQGNYDVLSVLATLAFDGRREDLFSKEFISAMKLLERDHIDRNKMLGSWAGAMGQTQFMPSSYLSYAADGDKDGNKDIWKNHYDVFSSIANYLHTVGWNNELPWGVEVNLTQYMDLDLSGIENEKAGSLQEWQNKGVSLKSFSTVEQDKLNSLSREKLWLVRPDKELGRAFLVSNNFRTLLNWNRSNYFAVSIGMFADRINQRVSN